MKRKLFGFIIVAILFSATAQAQYKFESLNPGCPLKKFVGGKWENASASELADKNLPAPKILAGSTSAAGIKFNNTWYSAPSQCFANGAASLPEAGNEAAPTPAPEVLENAAPKKSRNSSTQRSSNSNELPSFYLRLEGGYSLDMSEAAKAHSTDLGNGSSLDYAAATSSIPFGGAIGYNLNENYSLEVRVIKSGSKQSAAITSFTGTSTFQASGLSFALGTYYHFIRGSISPFLGANLGYATSNVEIISAGYSGALTSFNGTAKASASGISYAILLGCDITLFDHFALVPMISYNAVSYGDLKVSSSTSGIYDAGDNLGKATAKNLMLNLGLQYSF